MTNSEFMKARNSEEVRLVIQVTEEKKQIVLKYQNLDNCKLEQLYGWNQLKRRVKGDQ